MSQLQYGEIEDKIPQQTMPYLIYAPETANEIIYDLKLGTHTIGRAQDNTIVVIQENFSRYHAELIVTESGTRLRDLQSSNGTFVNDVRSEECDLKDGDRIACGDTVLQFVQQSNTSEDRNPSIIRRFPAERSPLDLSEILTSEPMGNSILQLREQKSHRREVDKLKLLLEITNQLLGIGELGQLWERTLELLFAIARVDRAAILVLDRKSQELECQAIKARSGISTDRQLYRSKIATAVRDQGRAILTATATTEQQNGDGTPGICGSIYVPLTLREETTGVLYVENLVLLSIYPEEDVEFLAAFAQQVAIAIAPMERYSSSSTSI